MPANAFSSTRRRKLKHVATATGAAIAIITLSACGGASESATTPEPSVSVSASAAPTKAPAAPAIPKEVNGIPVKGPAKNVNGKYLQTTLKANDPILNFDMNRVSGDNVAAFTPAEIKEAIRVASVFTAEEGIDSTLNGSNDPADVDAWWAANKHKIAPDWQDRFYEYAKKNGDLVLRASWDKANVNKREYWQDGSTRIQIRENKIRSVAVESKYPNSVGVTTDLNYIIWGKDKAGKKYPINVKGYFYLNMRKDGTTGGKWLIQGSYNEYEGFESKK